MFINSCCAKDGVAHIILSVDNFGRVWGVIVIFLFVLFWQNVMNLDKEIQCKEPCWDDKAIPVMYSEMKC